METKQDIDVSDLLGDLSSIPIFSDYPTTTRLSHGQKQKRQQTPDIYGKKAKKILDNINIRSDIISSQTMQILNNLNDFILPEKGEQLRIRTQQQINLISILLKIVEKYHELDAVTIATYTLNKEASKILLGLFDSGLIHSLSIFLSSSYSFRDVEYYNRLKREFTKRKNPKLHLTFCWLHLKITLIHCGENYYQIEGSMNYSMNNMIEQILIEDSQESYLYDLNFLNTLRNKNNKALENIC